MKISICNLKSVSPYSQSNVITTKKKSGELHEDYEKRTWRERIHYTNDEEVFIPPQQFANSLKEAARHLGIQIPGKGKEKFTKNFERGVIVSEPLMLGIKKNEVAFEWHFVPSDGKRGGGKRVWKCFPFFPEWKGNITYFITDDIITYDVFDQVLRASGLFIGIGRFRPANCGYYGRFEIMEIKWSEK